MEIKKNATSLEETRKAYEDETGIIKPSFESTHDITSSHNVDPWDQLINNQHLVKPIATPKDAIYTV